MQYLTSPTDLTGGTVANGTYYIGDYTTGGWSWSYPVYHNHWHVCPPVGVHEHSFEQVRSVDGGYEARLFCRGCGETKRLRAAK